MKLDGCLHGFTASSPGLPGFLPSGNLGLPAKDKGLLEESNPLQGTNCIHDHYTCQVLVLRMRFNPCNAPTGRANYLPVTARIGCQGKLDYRNGQAIEFAAASSRRAMLILRESRLRRLHTSYLVKAGATTTFRRTTRVAGRKMPKVVLSHI